jgi:hypothetical protein
MTKIAGSGFESGSISQRGMHPLIRIHAKMSWIRNATNNCLSAPGCSAAVSVLMVRLLPTLGSVVAAAGPVAALHHVFPAKLTLNPHLPAPHLTVL